MSAALSCIVRTRATDGQVFAFVTSWPAVVDISDTEADADLALSRRGLAMDELVVDVANGHAVYRRDDERPGVWRWRLLEATLYTFDPDSLSAMLRGEIQPDAVRRIRTEHP